MKTYDEMASSALKRIKQQRQKKQQLTKVGLTLCASCLLIAFGYFSFSDDKQKATLTDNLSNTIIINQNHISSDQSKLNLDLADVVVFNQAELIQYFGHNIFPIVPSDLNSWLDDNFSGYRIYYKNGKVYWDQQVLNYSNDDFSRSVNLEVAKDDLPLLDFLVSQERTSMSQILGYDVYIADCLDGYYQAQFICDDVGFVLTTKGLSEAEVIAVVESLLSDS